MITNEERATLRHSLVCAALTGLLSNPDIHRNEAISVIIAIADETMKQMYGE